MKKCKICGCEKELLEFNKFCRNKDGYRNDCRDCQKSLRKKYDKKYRESGANIESSKKYREKNKSALKIKSIEYYNNIKDDPKFIENRKAKEKEYRRKNSEDKEKL